MKNCPQVENYRNKTNFKYKLEFCRAVYRIRTTNEVFSKVNSTRCLKHIHVPNHILSCV